MAGTHGHHHSSVTCRGTRWMPQPHSPQRALKAKLSAAARTSMYLRTSELLPSQAQQHPGRMCRDPPPVYSTSCHELHVSTHVCTCLCLCRWHWEVAAPLPAARSCSRSWPWPRALQSTSAAPCLKSGQPLTIRASFRHAPRPSSAPVRSTWLLCGVMRLSTMFVHTVSPSPATSTSAHVGATLSCAPRSVPLQR